MVHIQFDHKYNEFDHKPSEFDHKYSEFDHNVIKLDHKSRNLLIKISTGMRLELFICSNSLQEQFQSYH